MSVVLEKELPKGWFLTNLENSIEILDGKRIPINSSEREKRQGRIPYYGATGQVGWIDDYIFDEEIVLLGEDGAPFFDTSKTKAYIVNGKSWVNNHAHVLKGISKLLENKFLCHFLNQINYHGHVNGTTRLKLNQSSMRKIPILIPPINEQKRIVAKIEELFSLVDSAKENLVKTKLLLKQYRQSILKHAFEGKLVPQDPNDEPASVLLEKIKKENPSQKTSDIVLEKELPKNWQISIFENIFKNHDGERIPVSAETRKNMKGKYPYYGASGIIDYVDRPLFKGKYLLIGEDGANLLSRSTPIAFIAKGEFWVNNHAHVLSCRGEIPLEFVSYYINSINLAQWISGTAQPKLNQNNMNKIPVPLPPLNEQKRIVAKIEESLSIIEKNEKLVDSLLLQYSQIKNSILKQAFKGKLVPQDPNDKPAQILLEKIQQERKKNGK